MEKPEFVELLGDYMKEISDPKNRVYKILTFNRLNMMHI
jgi:hypothetical protein